MTILVLTVFLEAFQLVRARVVVFEEKLMKDVFLSCQMYFFLNFLLNLSESIDFVCIMVFDQKQLCLLSF